MSGAPRRRMSPLAAAGERARRAEVVRVLRAALARHRGVLAAVASDPEVGVDRRILHVYARAAGMDLSAEAARYRDT